MKYAVVTGASSGLGLGFVKQLSERGYFVYGLTRNSEHAPYISNVEFVQVDVTNDHDLNTFVQKAREHGVDILINNAGLNKDTATEGNPDLVSTLGSLKRGLLLRMFDVNSVSPLMLVNGLRDHLNDGSFIINISSNRASFHDSNPSSYANYGYRASKVALNMYTQALSKELPTGVSTFCVHPGSIQTDMNPNGVDSPEVGANRILSIVDNWSSDKNGTYLNYDGTEYPL